jgi:ligand-binding SRPBCC domain-containing protein
MPSWLMAHIELVTTIAAPRDRCFDLARSVDAHVHSTRGTSERAIAGRLTGLLALDEEVTWRAKHGGFWLTLTSRITTFDRPNHFRDAMTRGPLKRLVHDHYFVDDGQGGTLMRDVFDFSAPLGFLGRLAESLWMTRHFRSFLEVRNRELKALAESDAWRQFVPGET